DLALLAAQLDHHFGHAKTGLRRQLDIAQARAANQLEGRIDVAQPDEEQGLQSRIVAKRHELAFRGVLAMTTVTVHHRDVVGCESRELSDVAEIILAVGVALKNPVLARGLNADCEGPPVTFFLALLQDQPDAQILLPELADDLIRVVIGSLESD